MTSPAGGIAGQAGGDAGQQQGQQDGGGEAQGGFDPAQLNSTLEGMRDGQEQMRAMLGQFAEQAQQWGQQDDGQQEGQQEQQPVDLSFLDDPSLDATQQAEHMAQTVEGLVQQRLEAALGEHIAPITERLDHREQQEAAAEFVQEFPEVGDPKVAGDVMELSRNYATQLGLPEEAATKLGNSYRFARIIYAATKAFEAAAEEQEREGSGDPGAAHLEGGGGAAPAGGQQGDAFDRMLAQKRGSSVLPYG